MSVATSAKPWELAKVRHPHSDPMARNVSRVPAASSAMHRRPTTLPTPSPPGSGEPEAWGGASRTAMSSPLGGYSITSCPHQQVPLRASARCSAAVRASDDDRSVGLAGPAREPPAAARRASSGTPGGQGASSRPAARSRSWRASRGSSDWRGSSIVAQGLPCSASRAGTVASVSSSGSTLSSSSHAKGVDTWAPTPCPDRPRPEHRLVGRVLVEVDEDPFAPLLLPPRRGDEVGPAPLELPGHRDGGRPHGDGVPVGRQAEVDVQPAVAGGLGVAAQAEVGEQPAHLVGGLPDHREGDAGLRVEVEAQLVDVEPDRRRRRARRGSRGRPG